MQPVYKAAVPPQHISSTEMLLRAIDETLHIHIFLCKLIIEDIDFLHRQVQRQITYIFQPFTLDKI